MARKKPKTTYPVKDMKAANQVLGEIAEIKRVMEKIDNTMNKQIDRLKQEAAAQAAPLQARLSMLENGLTAFAVHNKEDLFTGKRTRELDFGSLGYRRSTEIKPQPKLKVADVIDKVKELGFTAAMRIKESLNKDELRTWPEERLALIGARRVEKDVFWYEIKEEEVAQKSAA